MPDRHHGIARTAPDADTPDPGAGAGVPSTAAGGVPPGARLERTSCRYFVVKTKCACMTYAQCLPVLTF